MSKENETQTAPDSPPAKETTAEELVAPMAESMPEPTAPESGELFDEFPPDPNAPINTAPVVNQIKDKSGRVFYSAIHKLDSKGAPRLDKAGYFIPINKGRKAGSKNDSTETTEEKSKQQAADFQNQTGVADEFDNAAALYFDVGTGVMVGVISEEWGPENDNERQGMIKAVAAYLRAKGTVEITPGQALTFALIAYSGKRLNKPKTKEKLTLWFLKLKDLFKKPQVKLN